MVNSRVRPSPEKCLERRNRLLAQQNAAQIVQYPVPKVQHPSLTFKQFIEDKYLPHARQHKRSYETDESKFRCYMMSAFGDRLLNDISFCDVQTYLTNLPSRLSPATVNRHSALLSSIFRLAIAYGYVTSNPCQSVKNHDENPPPSRYFDDDELAAILSAIDGESNKVAGDALKFLILTGLRLNEALKVCKDHIDSKQKQLYLSTTKSGKSRHVPLNDEALDVLKRRLNATNGSPWIFPGRDPSKPYNNLRKAWRRILEAAGVDYGTIHDIRHSFASACVRRGISLYVVQQLLGHANPITTQRYAHLSNETLRQASSTGVQGFLNKAS